MNLAVASNLNDGVSNDELRTILATHYTPLFTNAEVEILSHELRLKSRKYILSKPHGRATTRAITEILTLEGLIEATNGIRPGMT